MTHCRWTVRWHPFSIEMRYVGWFKFCSLRLCIGLEVFINHHIRKEKKTVQKYCLPFEVVRAMDWKKRKVIEDSVKLSRRVRHCWVVGKDKINKTNLQNTNCQLFGAVTRLKDINRIFTFNMTLQFSLSLWSERKKLLSLNCCLKLLSHCVR